MDTYCYVYSNTDDTIDGYINGVNLGSGGTSGTLISIPNEAKNLVLGRTDAGAFWLGGYMCNVGMWTGKLTQPQIKSIMWKNYAGLTDSEKTNLVSWWNLDVEYDQNKHNDVLYGTTFDNHHAGNTSSFGAELISNGDFSNGTTGWTKELDSGGTGAGITMEVVNEGLELQLSDAGGTGDYAHVSTAVSGGFVVGKTYKFEIDMIAAENGAGTGFTFIRIGTSDSADEHGSGNVQIHYGDAAAKDTTIDSAGSYTIYYKATHAHAYLVIGARNDVTSLIFDNVSLKEVLGNTGQTL